MDDFATLLVDATERCFEKHGVAKTSMTDVASEARVSRTTLYKHFPKIEDVLQAVFVREFDRFEKQLRSRLASIEDAGSRLVEIVLATAENIPENAGIARLIEGPRTRAEARALGVGRSALNQRVEHLIGEPLDELHASQRLRTDLDRSQLIEWIRRLVLSLAISPQGSSRSPRARRQHIAGFLLPSICRET